MERLAKDLMNGEFRCSQVTDTGMKIESFGADVYFRLARGSERQYKVCTFRYTGALIHLEEINGFDNLVKHLRSEVVKWRIKTESCNKCGHRTHVTNLIYNDSGEYLCDDCFIESIIDVFEEEARENCR